MTKWCGNGADECDEYEPNTRLPEQRNTTTGRSCNVNAFFDAKTK